MDKPTRVILVDDHNLVRRGLAALLESDGRFCVVAEASNGKDAIDACGQTEADILILDLAMPRMNGIEALTRIRKFHAGLKILLLSMYNDKQFVLKAMHGGANGYVLKEDMDEELFRALETILAGEPFVSASVALDEQAVLTREPEPLTEREREVLQLIADGLTTREIAESLVISPHTAVRHRANLMNKLGVHNPAELLSAAVSFGLIVMGRTGSLEPPV